MVRITQPYYRQTRIQDSLHSADKIPLTARRLFLLCSWFGFLLVYFELFSSVSGSIQFDCIENNHLTCIVWKYVIVFVSHKNWIGILWKKMIWTWRLYSFKRSIFLTYHVFFWRKYRSWTNQNIGHELSLKTN